MVVPEAFAMVVPQISVWCFYLIQSILCSIARSLRLCSIEILGLLLVKGLDTFKRKVIPPLSEISADLGHSSILTTQAIYYKRRNSREKALSQKNAAFVATLGNTPSLE